MCVCVYAHTRAYMCNNNCSMSQIGSDYISITVQPPYREKKRKKEYLFALSLVLSRFVLEKKKKKTSRYDRLFNALLMSNNQKYDKMRHLFKKWRSNHQLMISSTNPNEKLSFSTSIYHQRVSIIEEEEFNLNIDDDQGSFDFNIERIDRRRFLLYI